MDGTNKILHIIGPPGFGKSTLAICVSNELISRGVVVRYIDMAQVTHQPVKQMMAEKILYQEPTHSDMSNVTFDHLLSWSGRRFWRNLFIFDNCDEPLNSQKDQFVDAIENLVKQSMKIKVLITSREEPLYVQQSRSIKVDSLTIDKACELLDLKSPDLLSIDEKIAIANLTGSVPLALQIVGSLLNRRLNTPSPSVIIAELSCQPIPTLSPADLNRNMRINASISVSYNYLKYKHKKIARYLSGFPGSFTKFMATAVVSQCISHSITDDYIDSSLDNLVTRSLLEYNPHTHRYHFHHLLREFFREVQLINHKPERGRFVLAFQSEMSLTLSGLTNLFRDSQKKALQLLDDETHNAQYLLRITSRPYNCSHQAYSHAIFAIDLAISSHFLSCRFSSAELMEPIRSIVVITENMMFRELEVKSILYNYVKYVNFVVHYGNLLLNLNGSKYAADWYQNHVRNIEIVNKQIIDPDMQKELGTAYTKFYINLLAFEVHIDEERIRQYNSRVLKKTIQLQPDLTTVEFGCSEVPRKCQYKDIGTAYFHIKEYEKSIKFFERALKVSKDLREQVAIGVYLVQSYEYIGDEETAIDAFERAIITVYDKVLHFPSTLAITHHRSYVRLLRKYGERQKALELEKKELNELLETGAEGRPEHAMKAYDLALQFYEQRNDTEAIAMATLALRIFEQRNVHSRNTYKLKLKILAGKALHRIGNTSDSLIRFKEVADWIIEHDAITMYKQEYSDSCWYLIFHMKYFNECYLNKVGTLGTRIIAVGLFCGYYLLVPPLDLYVDEEQEVQLNLFEELASQSRLKDILVPSMDKEDFALSSTFHYSDAESTAGGDLQRESRLLLFLKFVFKFALQFTIVRAVINVILIVVKLCVFTTSLFCLYHCLNCCGCGCCFCCCHLIKRYATIVASSFSILYTYLAINYLDRLTVAIGYQNNNNV